MYNATYFSFGSHTLRDLRGTVKHWINVPGRTDSAKIYFLP